MVSTNGTAGAAPQAGVLEGVNPIAYSASNPILLFIIQASYLPAPPIEARVTSCPAPPVPNPCAVSLRGPIMSPGSRPGRLRVPGHHFRPVR